MACKQALRGTLAAGQAKEGELAITSLEFEYLHRQSPCKKLIGGNDISNDIITLGTSYLNVCLNLHSFQLHADWQKSDSSVNGELQGNCRWNSNSRDLVASSLPFPIPLPEHPRELPCRLYSRPTKQWIYKKNEQG